MELQRAVPTANYRPSEAATRAQMVVFLVRTFGLEPPTTFSNYELLESPAPIYPARALSRGLEGYVDVSFTVTATGTVADLFVVSYTSSVFDKSAVNAVEKYRFKPRVVDGRAIEVTGVTARIVFKIAE